MAQNWFAGEASRIEPLRELTVPPRRQFDDEADLVGAVMEATPTVTVGTVTVGPRAGASESASRAANANRSGAGDGADSRGVGG